MTADRSKRARVSRRGLLIGGASVVVLGAAGILGVEENVLPGRSSLYASLGLNGPNGVVPNAAVGPRMTGRFTSDARLGKEVEWEVSYPPGSQLGDSLPVLIALHGFGGSHASAFAPHLRFDRFLGQAVERGHQPFAVASIDGGNSYWHKRRTGEDAAAMITDEFPAVLANHGLDSSRVGLLGWSMGGYGALHIGGLLGSSGVRAVIAESPALWKSADAAAKGAFDGPADFAANTPFGRQHELDGIATRVDCGIGDGFYPNAQSYVAGFATRPAGGFEQGGHNAGYWRRMAPAQFAFAARALAA